MRPRRPLVRVEAMKEMNITPLVDVMLVLLVIFMIAAPVMANQVPITLPQDTIDPPTPRTPVRLAIAADGQLRWNEQPLPAEGFATQLHLQLRADPQTQLVFVVEPAAPYARVADLAAIAQQAGVTHLAFENR